MKKELQQIAIANALGYTMEVKEINYDGEKIKFGYWRDKNGESIGKDNPPDYLNDYNAIHDAFNQMNEWIKIDFVKNLLETTRKNTRCRVGAAAVDLLSATTEEWAEAFLKTLNLWENEP